MPTTACKKHYKENRDCLLTALRRNFGEIGVSGEGSGLHLLWRLPPGVSDAASVEALARRRRIGVYSLASGGATALTPSLLERRALVIGFGALLPKQIEQGVDRLSEIVDDTIDDPSTDVTQFLVRVPGAPMRAPRPRSRTPAHLDSRFRQPALPDRLPLPRLMRARTKGAAGTMARVTSIYRYPVKGLSPEPLGRVESRRASPCRTTANSLWRGRARPSTGRIRNGEEGTVRDADARRGSRPGLNPH